MKSFIFLVTFFISVFCFNDPSFSDDVWRPVAGIKEAYIKEVAVDAHKKGIVYAASAKRLYRTEDDGNAWRNVFSVKGDSNAINFVKVSGESVFVCTEKGVFKSLDGKSRWMRIFKGVGTKESNASHIAFSKDGKIYLGTKGGFFISIDNGLTWGKDSGEAGNISVKWISFLGDEIFLATDRGVYKGVDSNWTRVFITSREETGYDSDALDETFSVSRPVNSMLVKEKRVFLASDAGILMSEDKGNTWKNFIQNGLVSLRTNRLLFKDELYALTDDGIFVFLERDRKWRALYKGMDTRVTHSLSGDLEGNIWVATDRGLYRSKLDKGFFFAAGQDFLEDRDEKEDVMEIFDHEPNIRDVQREAIEYAEVHPDKIKEWRDAANKKALLPSVSVGLDRYATDLYHWDAGQNPDVLQRGDDVITWDVTMTWNLGELVWNDDQTSIDTRSRLMVQLRDDILDEITRTYFERRRLQLESYLSPPADITERIEKELRIQELTADLDALTGGYFSKELE
ncbi:hypothetical protein ACFL28_00480 [Candidatus Omnitrophota bacterium]